MTLNEADPNISASCGSKKRHWFLSALDAIYSACGTKVVLSLILFLLTFFALVLNHLFFHYQIGLIAPIELFYGMPVIFIIYLAAYSLRNQMLRTSLILQTLWVLYVVVFIIYVFTTAISTTPFPTQDVFFNHLDQLLGYNFNAVFNFTLAHPLLHHLLQFCYTQLPILMILVPFLLASLKKETELNQYFSLILLTIIIGGLIFYFFPTTAPPAVITNPHFTETQYAPVIRLHEIRNGLPLTVSGASGMISFPSFHVIWALIMLNAIKSIKWVRGPLIIFGLITIYSTLGLGWHYLVDDLASVVIVGVAIWMLNLIKNPKTS